RKTIELGLSRRWDQTDSGNALIQPWIAPRPYRSVRAADRKSANAFTWACPENLRTCWRSRPSSYESFEHGRRRVGWRILVGWHKRGRGNDGTQITCLAGIAWPHLGLPPSSNRACGAVALTH